MGEQEEVLVMNGTIPEVLMQVGYSCGAGKTTASRGWVNHPSQIVRVETGGRKTGGSGYCK